MKSLTAMLLAAPALMVTLNTSDAATLIGPNLGSGNGEFHVTDASQVSLVNTLSSPIIALNRPRAMTDSANFGAPTDLADFSTITDGIGVKIDGWTIYRSHYTSSNGAFGVDGLYGFAPGPFGSTPGGQAFANAGEIAVVSDAYAVTGSAGDQFDVSFLAGSDQSSVVDFRAYLVFDDTTIIELAGAAADNLGGTDRTAGGPNELSDTLVAPAAYSTVRLMITGNAGGALNRALVDNVQMDVTLVPEPASLALLGLGGLAMLRRR
ncbi:MAG: PEP-CTERM sorting domain-containing protein [Gammaproteobacteria bacterium]|nr:MAG: PEP-CTERM sorting domain-containing protein [Gammaproteobacteria bacterium]